MNDFLLLILSLSLSGTVIAGLCFAVKAIWKKKLSKSVLYYLWLIALVRLVLPFSFEGALLNRIYEGDLKAPASTVSLYEPVLAVASQQTTFSIPAASESTSVQITETVSAPVVVSVNAPATVSADIPVMAEPNTTLAKPFDFEALVLWLWLAGFAVFCAFTLTSYGVFTAKLKKANQPANETVLEIGKQLGCKVKIYRNPFAKTPMLIGLFQPTIILPDVQYTEDEIKGALIHELTHKTRHDLLYKWFVLFVNAVHWFNPVVWLVRREVSRACELSCDEAVIMNLQADQKQTYGETLINLAAAHRYPAGVIATTLCEEKRTLKERLSAIMTYQKKGLLNKVLSGILIAAVVVSGTLLGVCGTLSAQEVNYPKSVNIYAPDFFYYANTDSEKQAKQQWISNMSQKYGVKLNIISDYKDSENIYSSTPVDDTVSGSGETSETAPLIDEHGNANFVGLTSISGIQELKEYQQYDIIVPLDDYLADNPIWNALPDDVKSTFKIDGHIYAIPTAVTRTPSARIVRNEALQTTGITITDPESFREFAKSYAQKTGKATIGCVDLEEMADVLNAFGLYPEYFGLYPISYDPIENSYVDFLTKDTAVDALEYLRELYKAGAVSLSFQTHNRGFDNGLNASEYTQFYNQFYNWYYYPEDCTALFSLSTEYPQVMRTAVSGFAMTKNTPHPQETINFILEMMFGSEENYLNCWLGSSDNYTLNSDGTITVKMAQYANGTEDLPCMPNLTGGLPNVFTYSNANLYFNKDGVADMDPKTNLGNYNTTLNMQYEAVKKGEIIELPLSLQNASSATFDAKLRAVNRLYGAVFKSAILDRDYTVQQIVDNYKEAMFNLGGNTMLDEFNASIGKETTHYYK